MTQSIKYYVSGYTAKGYVNYLSENIQDITHVIILRHDNEPALTDIFQNVTETYEEKGFTVEIISGLYSVDQIAGVIIRGINIAILAESIVQKPIPGAKVLDLKKYRTNKMEPFDRAHERQLLEAAYNYFEKGLRIHDQLEKIYINEMSFKIADKVATEFIKNLLQSVQKKQRQPVVYERLFGTNIPDGTVNHVEELIAPLENVFYVKGRAGTGKSVFMKKILRACKDHGLDAEVYRCSFDPGSIDMVIVRELNFCIFDSTSPHEFFPERDKGHIVDLYELTVKSGTDERYATEINKLTTDYKLELKKGMQQLKALKNVYPQPMMNLQLEPALNNLYKEMNKNL